MKTSKKRLEDRWVGSVFMFLLGLGFHTIINNSQPVIKSCGMKFG